MQSAVAAAVSQEQRERLAAMTPAEATRRLGRRPSASADADDA
jgi:hypothetical protein